jgi:uncharacterized protein YbgA (DUF1722 family)
MEPVTPGPRRSPGDADASRDATHDASWDATVQRARTRWERFRHGEPTRGGLVRVHADNKYLLLAHSPAHYRRLGRVVAAPPRVAIEEQVAAYQAGFDEALACPPSAGTHVNVLQHLAGYFKRRLPRPERARILDAIEAFRAGQASLALPLGLIAQQARALHIEYLLAQTYLSGA